MDNILKLYLLVCIFSYFSLSYCQVPSIWEELLSVSCELSGVVSRSRRAVPEGPNLEDPTEFFNYLYPLADLKLQDLLEDKQRSSSPLEISTWIDDLIDLWQTQCRSKLRRDKRDTYPQYDDSQYYVDRDMGEGAVDAGDNATSEPDTGISNTTATTGADDAKKEKVVVADSDTFFAQYGGDIEYFFPLVQFGIPFDGEITLLGFKGFKGIWPY